MLVFTHNDPISVLNHINSNYPEWVGKFSTALGVAQARARRERLLVFESRLVVESMSITPEVVDLNGKVDWSKVAAYMKAPLPAPASFVLRSSRILKEVASTESDKEHALSALSSNVRPDLRPAVFAEIVKFLQDRRSKFFTLPNHLTPQRGKTKLLYDVASTTDFTALKACIAGQGEDYFEAAYWRAAIKKHNTVGDAPRRARKP